MRFSSSSIKRRTSRKIGRKSVSAQAEACELRTLLSATVISVGAIDGSELSMEGGEDASAKVDATEIGSLLGAPIDPDFTEIMPGEPGVDDAIFYCEIADGDQEIPVEDPLAFIRFNTLFTSDDPGADDGTDGEKPVVDEEVFFEDAPPSEDWDPSWAYRSFVTVAGEDGDDSVNVVDDADVSPKIYFSLNPDDAVVGDAVVVDGDPVDGEEVTVVDSVGPEDTPPVEGWDPSWLYRTLTPGEGDGSEEIIVDQGTSPEDGLGCGVSPDGFVPGDLAPNDFDGDGVPDDFVMNAFDPLPLDQLGEDGLGCGVSPDGFVPGDLAPNDFDGDGMPDDFVMNAFDPLTLEDDPGKPVDVIIDNGEVFEPGDEIIYMLDPMELGDISGGPVKVVSGDDGGLEPVDGEVAVEVEEPASDPYENEEVHYALDPLPLDDAEREPVDVVADGELIPIRTLESSDFDSSVIFYTAAPGGVEVQRTNDAGNHPEESAAPSAVAIPIRLSASNSLFNANNGRSTVGIPAGVQSNLTPGNNSSPTKRNATQRRSTTTLAAARQSAASEGLNSLSPLLGGDEAQSGNDSPENSVDTQAVESESIEETVSDNGSTSSGASSFAANQNVQPRSGRAAMIDQVMAQYAENSFNS